VRAETAVSFIQVVMEVVIHRQHCLNKANAEADLPMELLSAAYAALEADGIDASSTFNWLAERGVHVPKCTETADHSYHRRANNQKSAEVEEFIRDLLGRGLSKTAIAKQLKVNRRVVIRVARETIQSAQS
jgi:DNA invertase Pin-like site-specific DNA recombinase